MGSRNDRPSPEDEAHRLKQLEDNVRTHVPSAADGALEALQNEVNSLNRSKDDAYTAQVLSYLKKEDGALAPLVESSKAGLKVNAKQAENEQRELGAERDKQWKTGSALIHDLDQKTKNHPELTAKEQEELNTLHKTMVLGSIDHHSSLGVANQLHHLSPESRSKLIKALNEDFQPYGLSVTEKGNGDVQMKTATDTITIPMRSGAPLQYESKTEENSEKYADVPSVSPAQRAMLRIRHTLLSHDR